MKRRYLVFQIIWLFLCCTSYVVFELGSRQGLPAWVQNQVFTPLQRFNSYLTDLRYVVRGSRPVKNPIVIVEIDETAIEMLGRWPWRRDYMGFVIDRIFEAGASYVGLDLFFSEAQQSVPEELAELLQEKKLGNLVKPFDFDHQLESTFRRHRDRLVLAWASESECRPAFSPSEYCPVTHPDALATQPKYFSKFAMTDEWKLPGAVAETTPLSSVATLIPNLERFESAAKYAAFVNDYRDKDGLVRRTSLLTFASGRPFATLPLMLARLWKGEDFSLAVDSGGHLSDLRWKKSSEPIAANALGVARINFRGKERTFPYISARDLLVETEKSPGVRSLASESKANVLKGAIALVGLTAIGLTKDVVATPFDATMPGVEVHANILDNLLSNDFLKDGSQGFWISLLVVLVLGSIFLIVLGAKLEARPALVLSLGFIGALFCIDFFVAFPADYNLNSAFHYIAFSGAVVIGLAAKYIAEEENRKFLRGAFSMYVAPAVVDSILKDPSQLSLGGRKEQMSILFSDIRSFTTYSEKMEPRRLTEFLNEYLGMQTEVVFAHGGTLDKYIGDAIMSFWGAPLKLPNHAALACQAVVAMMDTLEKHRERLFAKYGLPVRIGIGLNAGEVSVGNMGSTKSFNYTVIGDNVNLSSRLEGATKHFGVTALTTRETLDLAKAQGPVVLHYRSILEVKLKGKNKNTELIELRSKPLPTAWLNQFEEAKQLFKARRFTEAEQFFLELSKKSDSSEPDGPCLALSGICRENATTPPAPDWDGSYVLDSK